MTALRESDPDAIPSEETSGETDSADEFLRAAVHVPKVAPPSDEADLTGGQLGAFRIGEVIGRGGMGIVYSAVDERLGRKVALKVLPASLSADPERRARLLREARAASAVTHPNIATVFEVCEADGCVFIAMELVDGETLRQLVQREALPFEEATRIVREIADALGKAHATGIVHRDLKPDNVMLSRDGHIKILDFGLAKPIGSRGPRIESASIFSTAEGRILGTPSYMSPEQAKGRRTDARSDLFSLGVVFYELLSGRRPFVGNSAMEILIAIDRDTPERLEGIPKAVEQVVFRCLAKAPSERFTSAEELTDALDRALTRPASTTWSRRTLLTVATLVVVAIVVGVWLFGQHPAEAEAEPSRAAASAPSATQVAPVASSARETRVEPAQNEADAAADAAPSALPSARATPKPPPVLHRPVPATASTTKRDPLAEQK
jgi:serine/threonine protein kinase